jgi:hypothetical protein
MKAFDVSALNTPGTPSQANWRQFHLQGGVESFGAVEVLVS